jgi:hypothetical protein
MAILNVDEIIDLGDISNPLAANYQANGNIFGPRKAVTAPQTIALITDALRWQWEAFPDISEVRATATITKDTTGDTGQIITVTIDDPISNDRLNCFRELCNTSDFSYAVPEFD